MYLSRLIVSNFRQFGCDDKSLAIDFDSGVTALVGRNDSGKSTIIDAIRYALLTRDQNYIRVQPEDFHIGPTGNQATDIFIQCTISDLDDDAKAAFVEYLTYIDQKVLLIINWSAKRLAHSSSIRRWVDVSVRCGIEGNGPTLDTSARELLASTYLRPLRDAEREMSPGRGSRLSQILNSFPEIAKGEPFNVDLLPSKLEDINKLTLLGLSDYLRHCIKVHPSIDKAKNEINDKYLAALSLTGDKLLGKIDISDGGTEDARLRQILERLQLDLLHSDSSYSHGKYGLGSNNLLYMACELLLLGAEVDGGLPLLLIEEPEAHLHPQRQLRLMEFLEKTSHRGEDAHAVQVILSTHSPNLASKIPTPNIILLEKGYAFPLAKEKTKLGEDDYRFLERFLDVTKANLFFAHGVLVVEGDAEAILLPVLAKLIGKPFTECGVSVVNVGGRGLRRFSKIFQRSSETPPFLSVPVACITDIDVMPDCAPEIIGLVSGDDDEKWTGRRQWLAVKDICIEGMSETEALNTREKLLQADDGQSVKTFVSSLWTLEYELAFYGLDKEVYTAAFLAKNDGNICSGKKKRTEVLAKALEEYNALLTKHKDDRKKLCSQIYKLFHTGGASKAIAAQYLAELLNEEFTKERLTTERLTSLLPPYIIAAINHVCVK